MKFLLAALLAPALCLGAIWPENIGAWKRAATLQASLSDRPFWDEYGLKESEAARYENGRRKLHGHRLPAAGYDRRHVGLRLAASGEIHPFQAGAAGRRIPETVCWWCTAITCCRSAGTSRRPPN